MAPSVFRMHTPPVVVKAETAGESTGETSHRRCETLADAVHAVVHGSEQPCKWLADAIGVRYGYLADAANPHETQRLRLEHVAPLTRASKNPAILQYLADSCGYVLHAAPDGQPTAGTVCQDVARISAEFADVLARMSVVLADGHVSSADARAMRQELSELLEAAHAADYRLRRMEPAR